MNIYTLIRDYNDIVKTTLDEFDFTDSADKVYRAQILMRLEDLFTTFSQAKENSFYAELARFSMVEKQVNTVIDSNRRIAELFGRLEEAPLDSNAWTDDLRKLKMEIEQLMTYEENELFKVVEQLITEEEAFELAEELASERHILESNDHRDEAAEKEYEEEYVTTRKGEDYPGNSQLFPNKRQGVL